MESSPALMSCASAAAMGDDESPQNVKGVKRPRTEDAAGRLASADHTAVEQPQQHKAPPPEPTGRGGEGEGRDDRGVAINIRAYR